jgi:hypothetical protein
METIIFDTLSYAEKLTEAGMPEKQAKVMAEAQADIMSKSLLDFIATKADLKELKTEIDLKMNQLEIRLIKWFAGLFIVQIGVTVGIILTVIKFLH